MEKSIDPAARSSVKPKSRLGIKLLVAVLLLGLTGAMIALLPRGYSQDLSIIGKGGNVVVQVHDHDKVGSLELMNALNSLRADYESRVTFLVADLYTPQGKQFAEKHNVPMTALLFFAPNGERLKTLYGQQDAETIRETLKEEFGF